MSLSSPHGLLLLLYKGSWTLTHSKAAEGNTMAVKE